MPIGSDFSINASGDIRHISGTTVYTVLELHQWLQDLADNPAPAGDDALSILSSNPSKLAGGRSAIKPMSLTLLNGFNIDDTTAQFFKFGSIEQLEGQVMYTGLKTIGSILPTAPIYIEQNNTKVSPEFWADGPIQILVKGKTGGAFINSGAIRVFSRKYGYSYSDFAADLVPGAEQPAALAVAVDPSIEIDEATAAALSTKVTLTFGDTNQNLNNGNGSKLYKGTITLSGGCTLQEAYQYLMYITRKESTFDLDGTPGWRYRMLNAAYTPNASAPFGNYLGGTWFVAQGWWLSGVLAGEAKKYQLTAHDGTTQSPPNVVFFSFSGVEVGDYIMAARDNGSGGFLTNEYTLNGAQNNLSTVTVNGSIKVDTPDSGVIRIGSDKYTYTSWTGSVFTLSGATGKSYANAQPAFVPFIDEVASATSKSVSFKYNADFTMRGKARNSGGSPIVPFENTTSVTAGGGSLGAIRQSDV